MLPMTTIIAESLVANCTFERFDICMSQDMLFEFLSVQEPLKANFTLELSIFWINMNSHMTF